MKTSVFFSEVTKLKWFRRLSKSAWMIHGYLIGCLVVMPFCQSARAEGEGEFVQTSTESYVEIGLSTSEGTLQFRTFGHPHGNGYPSDSLVGGLDP